MRRIQVGDVLGMRELVTIRSERVQLPHPTDLVHLQFRRFAGCPICNLHLRSIAQRHLELVGAGIHEVAVFHSPVAELLPYQSDLPFAAIADPEKQRYAEFGGESSLRAVLSASAWGAAVRGAITKCPSKPKGESKLGLPADFLIAPDGEVLACKYGVHASD